MDWSDSNAEQHDNAQTHARVWAPAPGMLVTRARGLGTLAAIRWYTARADRLMAGGQPLRAVFHHWREITSFEPEARSYLRGWAAQRSSSLGEAHYLVSSKLLAMAISTAALALGRNLRAHTDERGFEQLLDQRVAELLLEQRPPG